MIEETKQALSNKVEDLKAKKAERMKLLNAEIEQRTELSEEKQEQNKIAQELKKKEKQLNEEIKNKQATAEKLNKKIEEIIKKEIEAAKKKAEAEAKAKNKPAPATGTKGTSSLSYTPEAAKLSADFKSNQGKLPWPVEKGIITRGFGQQQHPVLKSVIINNNGVDIKTEKAAKARSIFEGSVVSVITVPGMQKAVMIRHGEFFSVYSNLDEVFVKAGDKVTTKQELGIIHTNEEEDKTEVHFELWRGTEKMNPTGWISK
jgi:septal ring factor EnvC (AmiA/AmiB activator)